MNSLLKDLKLTTKLVRRRKCVILRHRRSTLCERQPSSPPTTD